MFTFVITFLDDTSSMVPQSHVMQTCSSQNSQWDQSLLSIIQIVGLYVIHSYIDSQYSMQKLIDFQAFWDAVGSDK